MTNPSDIIGKTIDGKYDILEEIGRGAMGVVYRARLKALEKEVAFKVLHKRYSHDEKYVKRFQAEAKISSSLGRHPNVAYVYGSGKVGILNYIVMELLPGGELFSLLHGGQRPNLRDSINLFMQASQGLAFIHEKGIVHRDLKPGNLMFGDDGNLKITDFGIATGEGADKEGNEKGGPGTPKYMSPEQIKGEPVDVRSDIYSMGIMLYELVTGTIPYPADTVQDLVMKVMTQKPIPVRSVNPKISDNLEAAIMRALNKDKVNRYQSVAEFTAAVAGAMGMEAPEIHDTSKQSFVKNLLWYHWLLVALAAVVLVAGVVMLFSPAKDIPQSSTDGGQVVTTSGEKESGPVVTDSTTPEQKVRELEQKAKEAIENRNLAAASAFLQEALEDYDANDYKCRLLLGEVLQKQGWLDESLKQYTKIHEAYPQDLEILRRLGQGYTDSEFYFPAITFFEKLLKLKPDDSQAILAVGLVYMKWSEEAEDEGEKIAIIKERYGKGLSYLNLVADEPATAQRPGVFTNMIKASVVLGKFQGARELLKKVPQNRRVAPRIYWMIGHDSLESKLYQQAVLELREATRKEDAPAEYWRDLGIALVKGRQTGGGDVIFSGNDVLKEAITALEKGGDQEDEVLLRALGWARLEYIKGGGKEVEPAVAVWEKLRHIIPDDPAVQAALTYLYQESDSLDKLIQELKKQLEQDPANQEAAKTLAHSLVEKAKKITDEVEKETILLESLQYSKLDQAVEQLLQVYLFRAENETDNLRKIQILEKMLEYRESPEVRAKISNVYVKTGLETTILADKHRFYRKSLEFNPQNKAATNNIRAVLGKYYRLSKNADEKIAWLREIHKVKSDDKQVIKLLLKLLLEKIKASKDEAEKKVLLEEAQSLEILVKQ